MTNSERTSLAHAYHQYNVNKRVIDLFTSISGTTTSESLGFTNLHMSVLHSNLADFINQLKRITKPVINQRGRCGMTALMLAISNEYTEKATELLNHGAEPNLTANDGRTPCMMAASVGDWKFLRILLNAGLI